MTARAALRWGPVRSDPNWRAFDAQLRAEDGAWVAARLDRAPLQWQPRIAKLYETMMGEQGDYVARGWLRRTTEGFRGLLLPLSASDADVRAKADALALECMRSAGAVGGAGLVAFWRACERFCEARGVPAPAVSNGEESEVRAAVARMCDGHWWRRRLREQHGRTIERQAIGLGYVHLRREKYVSDVNVRRRQQQKARNADTLGNITATNQHGDEFTLLELAERSNANPRIRRAELMTRIAGFERCAKELGHAAEFWTGTAPSRFHARLADGGRPNPRHDGSTARQAQRHLSKCFELFRSWLQRRGIRLYGFRIAEPHHDGCPHWHMILFMPVELVKLARDGFKRYFLDKHSPDEPGAQQNRVKFVQIDMARGSAAGYVAKYIAKNIDGYRVQKDLFGDDAVEGSERVDAWAATWGIRQFQQVGGAPVGVWRELRRVKREDSEKTEALDAAQAAADAGDFAGYLRAQGGPMVARDMVAVGLAKSAPGERWNPVAGCTEPAPTTRYGEVAPGRVFGVVDRRRGRLAVSRHLKWDLKGLARAKPAQPWTRVNNCTEGGGRVEREKPAGAAGGCREGGASVCAAVLGAGSGAGEPGCRQR